jgi:hypothetical protein
MTSPTLPSRRPRRAVAAPPSKPRRRSLSRRRPSSREERLHPVLSNAEVLEIRAAAARKLEEERHKAAKKQLEAETLAELRRDANLLTGDGIKDEIVTVTMDLAEHSACVNLDGRQYWHGQSYDVPRHVADTLRDIQARGWKHQDEVDGKNLEAQHRANRQFQSIRKGAPGGKTMSGSTGAVH